MKPITRKMTIAEKKIAIKEMLFRKTGEGFLDPDFYDNDIYFDLQKEGVRLCEKYVPGVDFFFIDSQIKQAAAIHDKKAVLIYKGMMDHLINLASMLCVVTSTLTPVKNTKLPWNENTTSWLNRIPFDWDNESYWWLHSDDHKSVFDWYLKNLFRFIVLHEIGHIYHKHGMRKNISAQHDSSMMHVAPNIHKILENHEESSESNKTAKHAREIVADTFAFCELTNVCKKDMTDPAEDKKSLLPIALGFATSFCIVGPFFWSMGLVNEMNEDTQDNSYPTHAFRLQSIESDALRLADEINFPHAVEILRDAMRTTVRDIGRISGDQCYLNWRLKLNTPLNVDHYNCVIAEKANWEN